MIKVNSIDGRVDLNVLVNIMGGSVLIRILHAATDLHVAVSVCVEVLIAPRERSRER